MRICFVSTFVWKVTHASKPFTIERDASPYRMRCHDAHFEAHAAAVRNDESLGQFNRVHEVLDRVFSGLDKNEVCPNTWCIVLYQVVQELGRSESQRKQHLTVLDKILPLIHGPGCPSPYLLYTNGLFDRYILRRHESNLRSLCVDTHLAASVAVGSDEANMALLDKASAAVNGLKFLESDPDCPNRWCILAMGSVIEAVKNPDQRETILGWINGDLSKKLEGKSCPSMMGYATNPINKVANEVYKKYFVERVDSTSN